MKRKLFTCICGDVEHQLILAWDYEDDDPEEYREVWIEVHLADYQRWYQRIIPAIRYIFGYKSRYGNFDSIGLNKDQLDEMVQTLQSARKEVWDDGEETK